MISEATRLVLSILFNDLDTTHLKKSKHLESKTVLKHHLIETKASGGHPMECLQNMLVNKFGSLNKLDCTFKKIWVNNLTITYPNLNFFQYLSFAEHLDSDD